MERSSSVATWEFMKGSSEDDGGSPEDEEDELNFSSLKRKGSRPSISITSPKRQRTAKVPSSIPTGLARLNGTNQASAGSLNTKSHRPQVSEPGPSKPSPASPATSRAISSGKEPCGVVPSSQIPLTPSSRRSESPRPTRLWRQGGQVTGKERSINTGLPVPRSRHSSGPTELPTKLRTEVIELSDSTDNDVPKSVAKARYANTGPPSTIRIPDRLPPKPQTSLLSEGTQVITIDDSDEETSSASKPKPALKAVSKKETVGCFSLSSAKNCQSAPSSPRPKGAAATQSSFTLSMKRTQTPTPHSGRDDNSYKMNVDSNPSNLPSISPSVPNGHRCVYRSEVTTPVTAESSARKPTPAVPLLDLRIPLSGRNGSFLPGSSRINSSKLSIGDTREPRPPVLLTKFRSQAKSPVELSGLDVSELKDVLTETVPLSSLRITQPLESMKSSSPAFPSSGRDLRPMLHNSEASAAMQPLDIKGKEKERSVSFGPSTRPSTKYEVSAHISSRPSSECIDLTLDSDSDASPSPSPAAPRPLPLPRSPHYASPLNQEMPIKHESPASPPLPKAKSRSIELSTGPSKTASPLTATRNNTPIRPMPLPLPTPRPLLLSQGLKKTPSSTSMSAVQDTQPTNLLLDKPKTPSSSTGNPNAHATNGSGIGHTSRSSSSSIRDLPVKNPLPPRTARKSTRGRSSNQGLLSSSPRRLVYNPGPRILTSAPLPTGSPSAQPLIKSSPKLFNKPGIDATQTSEEMMEVVTEDVTQASSSIKRVEESGVANTPKEIRPHRKSVGAMPEPIVAKPFVGSAATFDNDSELEYVDEPVPKPSFPELHTETDSTEMMDVEELLTASRQDSPIPLSVTQETTPDPLDVLGAERDLQLRRSTRSSRSASGEPVKLFVDDEFADSRCSSPPASPTPPEDFSNPAPVKTFGGFQSLNWRTYRQDPENMRLKCYFGKDLPHTLQDTINSFSEAGRRHRSLRAVLEAAIRENTADDEPDAPLIEIINEVDDDPTPPWEFHYSNKMWYGEDVPLPDLTKLVHCNCVGRCDPKIKPCACAARQRDWVDGMFQSPDFLYDNKGHVKATDYPVFECNDLCGCSDECRNRVVQHGRKCAIRIQKTAEKGWGVFAGAKKISAGSFIGLYAGELLTDRVGEIRGITYNKFGRTYLFDLDFWHLKEGKEDWDIQYTVDAYHAGNFTRFLNHSCDPNCSLVSCYINDSDLQKPLLTVFARRDIEPFEELCFSYSGEDGSDANDGEASRSSPAGDKDAVYVKCACKAWNCTGYMFK
ncbi:hypothetical protein C0992_003778 [Termitomyces sp. T32_za158]|nr:hypothetical protein C0992_003778 [Termitomyces sp. T32_za158]